MLLPYFEYRKSVKDVEYYEILANLMKRWEYEIVEFKEAKSGYDTLADIFLQSATRKTYASSNMAGSFLVLVRDRKPRQRRLLEQHTKKVTIVC